eukprot:1819355-Rhodomonas_salina.3
MGISPGSTPGTRVPGYPGTAQQRWCSVEDRLRAIRESGAALASSQHSLPGSGQQSCAGTAPQVPGYPGMHTRVHVYPNEILITCIQKPPRNSYPVAVSLCNLAGSRGNGVQENAYPHPGRIPSECFGVRRLSEEVVYHLCIGWGPSHGPGGNAKGCKFSGDLKPAE